MAVTPSTYVEIGSAAPPFTLPDTVSGEHLSLEALRGANGTVVMFICNHCPFVLHVNDELIRLANDYSARGIGFVAISSNDAVAYPQDGPKRMKTHAERLGYPFPYLYDESQAVAKAYDAACTPDFYVFDGALKLVYHGQLDDSRPGNRKPVTGRDMRAALDACLAGTAYAEPQKPSMGCNIKWK
ncbi:MAG: thioredoxin family protein [Bacteroidota bacterium]